MVGNDQYLECTSLCEAVSIDIQDNSFTLHLYILPIFGTNIVFGVQWLKTLGPVLTNYNTLSMQFFYQDRLVVLQGEHETHSGLLTQHQFCRIFLHQSDTSYFQSGIYNTSNAIESLAFFISFAKLNDEEKL